MLPAMEAVGPLGRELVLPGLLRLDLTGVERLRALRKNVATGGASVLLVRLWLIGDRMREVRRVHELHCLPCLDGEAFRLVIRRTETHRRHISSGLFIGSLRQQQDR